MPQNRIIRLGFAGLLSAIGAGGASAHGVVTAPLANYNSASVGLAGGTITVPFGGIIPNAVYTVSAGTTLEINSRLTVTLPTNFLFQSVPSITAPGTTTMTVVSGGAGSNFVTYAVIGAAVPAAGTLFVNSFTASGATALAAQFGGSILPMTFQATNNANSNNNDASPIPAPVFTHAVGSLPSTVTPGGGQIDLGSQPIGTKFVPAGQTTSTSGLIAVFQVITETNDPFNSNSPVLKANGTANSLNAADTANVNIDGPFAGVGTVYASSVVAATCSNAVPAGAVTGTVSSTSIGFSGLKINTPYQICMIPNGTTLLQAGNQPYVFRYDAGSSTDFFGGLSQTTAGNFYTYNGSVIQEILYSGDFSGTYPTYIRLVNDNTADVSVVAEVKTDSGSLGDTAITVPRNNNVLIPAATIINNAGVALDSTGRASIIFATVPAQKLSIAQLMINPNGTIVQLGSGSTP